MNLHSDLAQIEIGGDLLVQTPGHHESHHFSLARAQCSESLLQLCKGGRVAASDAISFNPYLDRVEQILIPERLSKKLDSACLDCANGHGNITVAADEDDRVPGVRFDKL